jgi:hypothetical protein
VATGQRQVGLIVLAVVVFGVAGYFVWPSKGKTGVESGTAVDGVCLACKAESVSQHKLGEAMPYTCPKCSQAAVYPWYFCFDCKHKFVPMLERGADGRAPRIPTSPICPLCHKTGVMAYVAGICEATGNTTLPPWP